jgi:transcriptional regulator with XRE-family HTH domain
MQRKVLYINTLRKHRRLRKYTQKEVADYLGIKDMGLISKWENGRVSPTLINLFKLSILYSVTPEILFSGLVKELRKKALRKKIKRTKSISNKNILIRFDNKNYE